MGAIASTAITLEDFAKLPGDGVKHEVDSGELITFTAAKSLHARIVRLVSRIIERAIADTRLEVFVEAGFLLSASPLTIRQPDVSVLSKHRIASSNAEAYFEGAPELAAACSYHYGYGCPCFHNHYA